MSNHCNESSQWVITTSHHNESAIISQHDMQEASADLNALQFLDNKTISWPPSKPSADETPYWPSLVMTACQSEVDMQRLTDGELQMKRLPEGSNSDPRGRPAPRWVTLWSFGLVASLWKTVPYLSSRKREPFGATAIPSAQTEKIWASSYLGIDICSDLLLLLYTKQCKRLLKL